MESQEIKKYLTEKFEDIEVTEVDGDIFFMHRSNNKLPFATLITKDNEYDAVSNLNREGFFRFNFCINKEIFDPMFGRLTKKKGLESYMDIGIDFTKEDVILPHPTYGSMNWVCVVNPSDETFETIKEHLEYRYKTLSESDAC